jgi:hypothetical protein
VVNFANQGIASWWDLARHALDEPATGRRDRPDQDERALDRCSTTGVVGARHRARRIAGRLAAALAGRGVRLSFFTHSPIARTGGLAHA